jgi:hypothetical protein
LDRGLHHTRDDSGIALLIVIGAIALMVVVATGAFYFASQTLFDTQMADQHDAAFQAASSGVMVAFADLRSRLASRPAGGTWTGSIAASSAAYTAVATLNPAQTAYTCVSTGTSRDGTKEVVNATFAISVQSGSSLPWGNNVFYFAGYSGGSIVGNGTMTGPLYVAFPSAGGPFTLDFGSAASGFVGGPVFVENGSLTIKGTPPAPIDIYLTGTLTLTGNAKNNPSMFINHGWDPTKRMPVTAVNIASYEAGALARATSQSADNVMGDTTVVNYESQPVATPTSYAVVGTNPPNNRPTGWLRSKAVGAGTSYKVISGGLTIGPSTASFGSWSGDGHCPISADLHDDFAYDSANHVLYIDGTVYISGDLSITRAITYVGNGTLVCTGNVSISGSVTPATANGADGTPDPDARHLLCVFSGGAVSLSANATGAFYSVGQLAVSSNNCTLKGSFIAEQGLGTLSNNTAIVAVPLIGTYVSPGMPTWGGGPGSTTTLSMSGWHRQ